MSNTICLPKDFTAKASKLGINKEVAAMFFSRKTQKKGYEDLKVRLVKEGVFRSDTDAGKALGGLWKIYRNEEMFGFGDSPVVKEKEPIKGNTYLEMAREGLENLIGSFKDSKPKPFSKSKIRKQVIASDSHFPFASQKSIDALLSCGAQDIFFVGDLFDMYAASRYRQEQDVILAREELAQGRAFVEKLSETFETVYMLKNSNHDMRPLRRVQDLFPQLLPLIVNPVELVCDGLDNVALMSTEIPGTAPSVKFGTNYEAGYMAIRNDRIFSHMENFCGSDGVNKVDTWVKQWAHILPYKSKVRAIFHAHVHRLSLEYTPSGVALVQTGCLCNPMGYQIDGHGKYSPPTQGFVLVDEIDGELDLNSLKMVYTG